MANPALTLSLLIALLTACCGCGSARDQTYPEDPLFINKTPLESTPDARVADPPPPPEPTAPPVPAVVLAAMPERLRDAEFARQPAQPVSVFQPASRREIRQIDDATGPHLP